MKLRTVAPMMEFGFKEIDVSHLPSLMAPSGTGAGDPPTPEPTEDERIEAEARGFDLSKVLKNPKIAGVLKDWAEREVVAPVKAKNTEIFEKLARYKVKGEDGKDIYLDPDEAKTAIEKIKSGTPMETQKEVDRAVEAANSRNKVIIEGLSGEKNNLIEQLAKERTRRIDTIINNDLSRALVGSGVKPGKMHLHEMYLRTFIRVAEENGKEVLVVMDENDLEKPRYGSKGLMTVPEFISEYKNREGVAEDWQPTVRGGSGTMPPSGGTRFSSQVDPNLSPTERLKIARSIQAGRR